MKFTRDENRVDVDQSLYKSMTDSLLYLTARRLDITFSVSVRSTENTGLFKLGFKNS